jgi:hypothetical protein
MLPVILPPHTNVPTDTSASITALADDQRAARHDLALDVAVDPDRALVRHHALEPRALPQERDDFVLMYRRASPFVLLTDEHG